MDIPPCTEGKHSTTDLPPQIEKKEVGPSLLPSEPGSASAPPPPPRRIPIHTATAAAQSPPTPPPPPPESDGDDPALEIPNGRVCRRKGCGAVYKAGQARDGEECVYHPGAPIFHEGSKGYTCCKRRVLEFDQFMKIEGCETKDRHLFVGSGKKDAAGKAKAAAGGTGGDGEEVVETVRYVLTWKHLRRDIAPCAQFDQQEDGDADEAGNRQDFYQTSISVIASFFLKKINKGAAKVEFRPQQILLDLPTTDSPVRRYKAEVPLYATIDPEKSKYIILGTKLEVTLAKADGSSWPVLRSDDRLTGSIIQTGRAGRA
jgi:hypothetical protein